jgi:AcrR family transcriptional regulator
MATRKYQQKRRAEQQSDTRRRIVEAVAALHGEIGPARTTIKAIAERAGVERLTVYRHFADEGALFAACDAHFRAETLPPDPATWADVTDPAERLRTALLAFYGHYRRGEGMIAHAQRDAPQLPALAAVLAPYGQFMEGVRKDLQAAWPVSDDARARLGAAIGHALRFDTWRSLARVAKPNDRKETDPTVNLARAAAGAKPA